MLGIAQKKVPSSDDEGTSKKGGGVLVTATWYERSAVASDTGTNHARRASSDCHLVRAKRGSK